MAKLKYMKVNEECCAVRKGTAHSAAFDLISPKNIVLEYGHEIMIDTGLVFDLEEFGPEYHLLVLPRSSSSKHGIRIKNTVGLIDFDYRGPKDTLKVILFRDDPSFQQRKNANPIVCNAGDAFAQVVVQRHAIVQLEEVDKESWPDYTVRGGFGSTNAK